MLDGCWMTSLKDEKYYHECLVHPALSSINEKSNVLVMGCEGNADATLYNKLLSQGLKKI